MILLAPHLLTMGKRRSYSADCAVAINRGVILEVGAASRIVAKYPRQRIIRLADAVLLPGLINVHTHLELPPLLDEIRARSFGVWVLNLVRAKKTLQTNDYEQAVRHNIAALIQSGVTTTGEISTHRISAGHLKKSGIRATVYQEVITMDPRQSRPFLPRPFRETARVQAGLSPHSPYTVSEEALRFMANASRRKGLRLSMHVAESKDETRLLKGSSSDLHELYRHAGWDPSWALKKCSPVEYLHRIGFLNDRLLSVHAVQVSDSDIALIKKSGTALAHCPRSNKETGVGRMPLKKVLDAGITVGLGTDSLASSPTLNLWDEMRYTLQIHLRDGITARDILGLATTGGAAAMGMKNMIGTLEPGKRADIIAVPLPEKDTGDLCSDLLRETNSCIMSIVDGKILKR